ncbi:MAG: alpha/beta hydrolase [Actinomycetota bacterium]
MPEVIFNGPDGRLEGRYQHGKSPTAPVALLLHPHPQHGGTMNNKVVYALYQSFVKRGFSTLRFNFRGVGRSQGRFDNGQGELSDAAAALDWMQSFNANAQACWVAGFSFGAWIGMQLLMRRPEIDGFVSVAPPANMFDFSFLAPCPSSGLIVHGSHDDLVPEPSVSKLASKLGAQRNIRVRYRTIDGANHFFGSHLDHLSGVVDSYLDEHLGEMPARPVVREPEPEMAVAMG